MLLLYQGKEKKSILSDEFCDEQVFLYLFPTSKFSYIAPGDIPINAAWCFIQ